MDVSRRDEPGARGVRLGVGGRLRQRLARMLLHSSCATTSATAFVGLASANAGAASRLEPLPLPLPPLPPCSKAIGGRCQRRHRRHGSARALVHISIDCSARSVGTTAVLPAPVPVRGAGTARNPHGARKSNGNGGSKKPRSPPLYSWSSSSTDTDGDELAPFSSEEAEARSTLVSSRSFSSDSTSDFYYTANGPRRPRRRPRRAFRPPPPAPAAGNSKTNNMHGTEKRVLQQDGRNDECGTAVVKRSVDPYADFRSSMAEMVAGRRIRGADALSELLARYLALNAPRHHPAILAAFEDVWEAILGDDEP